MLNEKLNISSHGWIDYRRQSKVMLEIKTLERLFIRVIQSFFFLFLHRKSQKHKDQKKKSRQLPQLKDSMYIYKCFLGPILISRDVGLNDPPIRDKQYRICQTFLSGCCSGQYPCGRNTGSFTHSTLRNTCCNFDIQLIFHME